MRFASLSKRIAGRVVAGCVILLFLCAAGVYLAHGDAVAKKPKKPADNSECLICHADFKSESLATQHAKAGIGCFDCHGPSLDHGDDELNIMLPDVLFGRKEIPPFCTGCHEEKEHPKGEKYQKFMKKWSGKYRPNGRVIRDKSICTDCHGNHAVLTPGQQQFPQE